MALLVYKLPYLHSFTDRGTLHESPNTLLKCRAQSRSLKNRILKHMFSFVCSGLFLLHSSSGHLWLLAHINYSYWSNAKEHICARYCSNTSGNQSSLKKAPVRDFLKDVASKTMYRKSNWRQMGPQTPHLLPNQKYHPPSCTGQAPYMAALFLQTPWKQNPCLPCSAQSIFLPFCWIHACTSLLRRHGR